MLRADSVLAAPTLSGRTLSLSIPSRSGINYFLEATDDLGSHIWTPVHTALGIGGFMTMANDLGTAWNRFYRLRME